MGSVLCRVYNVQVSFDYLTPLSINVIPCLLRPKSKLETTNSELQISKSNFEAANKKLEAELRANLDRRINENEITVDFLFSFCYFCSF